MHLIRIGDGPAGGDTLINIWVYPQPQRINRPEQNGHIRSPVEFIMEKDVLPHIFFWVVFLDLTSHDLQHFPGGGQMSVGSSTARFRQGKGFEIQSHE